MHHILDVVGVEMGLLGRLFKGLMDSERGRKIAAAVLQPYGHVTQEVPRQDMNSLLQRFVGDVYSCVTLIAQQLAESANPHVYVKVPKGKVGVKNPNHGVLDTELERFIKDPMLPVGRGDTVREITEHPILDLFRNINPLQTPADFFEILSTFLDLTGEAYVFFSRGESGTQRPDEMWSLPPQWVTPRYDALPGGNRRTGEGDDQTGSPLGSGVIKWFQYGPGAQWVSLYPSEVIMIRRPSPYHQVRGFAPLAGGIDVADSSTLLRRYQKALLTNRGVPDVLVRMSGTVDEEKLERFQADWKNAFGQFGGGNGGVAVVPADEVDVQTLGFKPKDMENIKASRDIRELICNVFKVPVTMLSMEASTRATAEAGLFQMAKMAIKPRMLHFQQRFNGTGGVTEMFGDPQSLFMTFDDPVPADKEWELKARVEHVNAGITSPNEERAQMGLPPRPDGDEFRDPINTVETMQEGGKPDKPDKPDPKKDDDTEKKIHDILDRWWPKYQPPYHIWTDGTTPMFGPNNNPDPGFQYVYTGNGTTSTSELINGRDADSPNS